MNINRFVESKKAELTQRGLLPRTQGIALPSQITAARPSMRTVRQAAQYLDQRPQVTSTPFSILFDVTLPEIQPALMEKGEILFKETLDLLCYHGQRMIEDHGRAAIPHLESLFGDLPLYKDTINEEGWAEKIVNAYKKKDFENDLSDYFVLLLGNKIELMQKQDGHISSFNMTFRATDRDLERIGQSAKLLQNLKTLVLNGCRKVTDEGISHLKNLANLGELWLYWCDLITDESLFHLKHLIKLQKLHFLIDTDEITDAGMRHLGDMINLKELGLSDFKRITDKGLVHLGQLTALESLNLSSCTWITDEGLAHLHHLANLRTLDLHDCINITEKGLALIKRKIPGIEISK